MTKEEELQLESATVTMDAEARELFLFGPITSQVASQLILGIRQLDRAAKKNISLIISSGGGEEPAGWAIYDALSLARSKVVAQCYGECMSITALILQGCDTRILAPNCRFMIHNGMATLGTLSLEKIRTVVKEENILTEKYYQKLSERSELDVDKVRELCDKETYMSAEVAVGYGFADAILGVEKKIKKGRK